MHTPCEEKIAYMSKANAEKLAKVYADIHQQLPLRAYKCEKCGKWHLTSKDKELHKQQVRATEERKQRRHDNMLNREKAYWEDRLLSKDERRINRKRKY